ncbi:MAG: peroxiredoxin [Bacteroidetes bacterium]|nr:peroxiredoxin [Bacteroidota bacterium]
MKTLVLFIIILIVFNGRGSSQNSNYHSIPLIGEEAPSFLASTTTGTLHFPSDFGKSWKILFSHPADFTPVCTSEILALAAMQDDFKKLNVKFAIISTDALVLHQSWVRSMDEMMLKCNSTEKIEFPLIDDSNDSISLKYGMISPFVDSRKTVRGVFIIDPENKIQAIFFYPKYVGRNLEEIKRTVVALQTAKSETVLIPVNWKPGADVLLPYPYPYSYYDSLQSNNKGYYNLSWYMLYRKLKNKSE